MTISSVSYDNEDAGPDTGYAPDDEAIFDPTDGAGVKPGSLLAKVAAAAQAYVAKPTRIEIPAVAGLFAEYSTALESRQLNKLRVVSDRYPDKSQRTFRWNLLLLAQYNTGLFLNGEQLTDGTGEAVTFRNRELWEQFGSDDGVPAVRDSAGAVYHMYGMSDFDIIQAVNALMSDAGIDTELARQDPSSPG